jgi:DNA-binding transcriptional MocR family regulator
MMPTLHNPLGDDASATRHEIVEIVRKYGLFVIEDDVYGYLATGGTTSLRRLPSRPSACT